MENQEPQKSPDLEKTIPISETPSYLDKTIQFTESQLARLKGFSKQSQDQVFAGCRIEGEIGQGSFGKVYKAWQIDLERFVALKVIAFPSSNVEEWKGRFLREANGLSAIRHTGVVMLYQAGFEDDIAYLIMELAEGESLESWWQRNKDVRARLKIIFGGMLLFLSMLF